MKGNKAKVQREAEKEYEQSIHMVKAPSALQQEKIKVEVSQQQSEENPLMEEWFYQCLHLCFLFCFQFNIYGYVTFLHKAQVTCGLVITNLSWML